jgi:hypothetical protein
VFGENKGTATMAGVGGVGSNYSVHYEVEQPKFGMKVAQAAPELQEATGDSFELKYGKGDQHIYVEVHPTSNRKGLLTSAAEASVSALAAAASLKFAGDLAPTVMQGIANTTRAIFRALGGAAI